MTVYKTVFLSHSQHGFNIQAPGCLEIKNTSAKICEYVPNYILTQAIILFKDLKWLHLVSTAGTVIFSYLCKGNLTCRSVNAQWLVDQWQIVGQTQNAVLSWLAVNQNPIRAQSQDTYVDIPE